MLIYCRANDLSLAAEEPEEPKKVGEWIDAFNVVGNTVIMESAQRGNLESVLDLISKGADLNLVNTHGDTALMLAVKAGMYHTSKELVQHGSDLKLRNKSGKTPLLLAVFGNHEEIVDVLLNNGVDPNESTLEGLSVLAMAAQGGKTNIIKSLMKHGVKVSEDTKKLGAGNSAFMFAASSGNINVVRHMLSAEKSSGWFDVDAQNEFGFTALILASSRGYLKVVELLIENGAQLNIVDTYGRSALTHSTYNRHQDITDVLVANGIELPKSGYRVNATVLKKRKRFFEEKNGRVTQEL